MRVGVRFRVRARVRVRVRVRARVGVGVRQRRTWRRMSGSSSSYMSGRAWMVKRSEIGGLGGGSLERPRQWLGAQQAGLFLGVPS